MSHETFLDGKVQLCCGDSLHYLKDQPDNRFDSIVTDPPYALISISKRFANSPRNERTENTENPYGRTGRGFMGQRWDTGETAFAIEFWEQAWRVLKPGGHVVAFSGTRTYHRLVCAIEDGGFEIRDQLAWVYGSGFPKSHDVAKGVIKAASPAYHETLSALQEGARWAGWGTALKPAWEPICLGRKPMESGFTVAHNVRKHGVGGININDCRVEGKKPDVKNIAFEAWRETEGRSDRQTPTQTYDATQGRWPANIIHDGSDEVIAAFPVVGDAHAPANAGTARSNQVYGEDNAPRPFHAGFQDNGSAARFFYSAKADSDDRLGSKHPTVKPVDLMQWLVRLVTPKGGLVLDPFAGTGTTAEACFREGMRCAMVERETEYQADIRRRMALVLGGPDERRRESIKAKTKDQPVDHGPLFGPIT